MKTNLLKIHTLLASILLVGSAFFGNLAYAGGGDGGGSDPVESLVRQAKTAAAVSLEKADVATLSPSSQVALAGIPGGISRLISEVSCLSSEYDHVSTEPFQQSNGSKTWIETDGFSCAPIRIRSKVMSAMAGKPTLSVLISNLGHEIGHHIFQNNENKSWEVAGIFSELFDAAVKRLPVPSLINLPSGKYVSVDGDQDCLSVADIQVDPIAGSVMINLSTVAGIKCRFNQRAYLFAARKGVNGSPTLEPVEEINGLNTRAVVINTGAIVVDFTISYGHCGGFCDSWPKKSMSYTKTFVPANN